MPKLNEVFDLLKEKSSHWSHIGRELGISFDARESLKIDCRYPSDRDRLEKVLSEWLSTIDESLVTWEEFIRVLTDDHKDIVRQTKAFLQNI